MDHYQLQRELSDLGLSKEEALIYIHLLKFGREAGGSSIASSTKLHRQYVYRALPNLIELGLVSKIQKGKQNKYIAKSPQAIEKIGRKLAIKASDLTQELNMISNIGNEQEFEVIQGSKSICQSELDYIYSVKEPYSELILGSAPNAFQQIMGVHLQEYLSVKLNKGILVKYLGSKDEADEYMNSIGTYENQLYRYIKNMPVGIAHMVIRPKNVCFFSFVKPPHVYVVKSEEVADHYKKFFEMLWEMSIDPTK